MTEAVTAVQQQIEGLAIEWIEIADRLAAVGTTIGDGQFRTKTGSSIVAVIRDGDIDAGTRTGVRVPRPATSSSPSAPSRVSRPCAT